MSELKIVSVTKGASNPDGGLSLGRFLQSSFWAEFKSEHGWQSYSFCIEFQEKRYACSVLVRTLKKLFSIAYIPLGIDFFDLKLDSDEYFSLLCDFAKKARKFLPKNTFCVRFDPPVEKIVEDEMSSLLYAVNAGLKKPMADIQPPDTVIMDLSLSKDDLLNGMKPKWRYNMRLAEKKGVTVKCTSFEDIDVFYDLYLQTAKRDGIAIHSKNYYQSLLEKSKSDGKTEIRLYIASHENEPLAAIITLFNDYEGVYLYGASSNSKRNLMPAYLLQWTAINDAKEHGCKFYDFYGIPPTDSEDHPMHGLYRFKTGFGGRIVHRVGSFDYPLSVLYGFYKLMEKIRVFWFKVIKKKLAGR